MSRTLSEIYTEAKAERDKNLNLTEIHNSSKMSIMDAFTWVTSTCIWTFENILDVFKADLAKDLRNRVNGTPAYFANALLKYQSGDKLVVNEEGTSFSYDTIDETKRIITKASYAEVIEEGFHDKLMVFKVSTGQKGAYAQIPSDEMVKIKDYLDQILFAGQHAHIVSRKGDILVPKLTVYYDGAVTKNEVLDNIENALNEFIAGIEFDGVVYFQKIIDCIQSAEHVTDVYVDTLASDAQGIFVAQYDDDNNLIKHDEEELVPIGRYFIPNSGYLKQSTKGGVESKIPTFREAIVLKIEDKVKSKAVIGLCNPNKE